MTRYVIRRVNGSWQVQDSQFHDFVMGEYGPGASGHKQASAVADGLNHQPPPPTTRIAALNQVNDLRSPAGLVAWRHAHKLSQQKLADLLEVHKQTVLRWELGQVPIPRTTELSLLYLDQTLLSAVELPSAAV